MVASSLPAASMETLPGGMDAVALGADLPAPPASSEMAVDEGADAMAVDSAPSLSASWQVQDKAPSVTITLGDYTWVEHEDVEQLQAWIQAQLEEAKDPSVVLPLIEDKVVMLQKDFPYLAVIDLFSRSQPWWDAVCRFYSVVPGEVDKIKGQDISPTVLARWQRGPHQVAGCGCDLQGVLQRSEPLHQRPHAHERKAPFQERGHGGPVPSNFDKGGALWATTGRRSSALMQPRASTGLYPRTSSRIFRSEVAEVFRSLPKLVVERMVDNLDLSSLSLLEDAILNIGGHLRSRMATLKQEEILKRQGKGFGTATVPRPHTSALPYICSNPGCGGRFASSPRTFAPGPSCRFWRPRRRSP